MGSIIRITGSLLYLNSRHGFNGLKYMNSVISVIVDSLPSNTKNRESTRSWTARVRLVHSWAATHASQPTYIINELQKKKKEKETKEDKQRNK